MSKPQQQVRCACFIPGGIQCVLPMYHTDAHQYEPYQPFSQYTNPYPNIDNMVLTLASAHGMFHRGTTREQLIGLAMQALQADGVATEDVQALEAWLGTLTEEQLETLVDGEESEMAALVAESPTSPTTGMCVAQLVEDVYNWLAEKA